MAVNKYKKAILDSIKEVQEIKNEQIKTISNSKYPEDLGENVQTICKCNEIITILEEIIKEAER